MLAPHRYFTAEPFSSALGASDEVSSGALGPESSTPSRRVKNWLALQGKLPAGDARTHNARIRDSRQRADLHRPPERSNISQTSVSARVTAWS
jgi:hypothetical protein